MAVATLLILTSIGLGMLLTSMFLPFTMLVLAVCAAGFGARCLWLARTIRENERIEICASLEKKRAQFGEMEKEQRYAAGRLAVLAETNSAGGAREVLKLYEEWKAVRSELRSVDAFETRRAELEKEITQVREKMASFSIGGGSDVAALDSVDAWESLHRDYVRFFEAQRELDAAQDAVTRIENDLAAIESERAAVRESIEDTLRGCGIDPSRDLDESIERVALRAWTGEGAAPLGRSDPEFGIPIEEPDLEDAPWQSQVSTRAEAIVRRFLPRVRGLEVGPRLDVTLQLDPQSARLDASMLERELTPPTRDLVAFAVRVAAMEARSRDGESTPIILDDPLVRVDDARYDRVLEFLAEDACAKGQVVLLTCHEVRLRSFLDRHPGLRARFTSIVAGESPPAADSASWAALPVEHAEERSRTL
jgi:hypothetical protein